MISIPTPLAFIEFQIEHYAQRLANARTIEERIFLRKQHYDLKQQLQAYLN